jgi:hypothetical protein
MLRSFLALLMILLAAPEPPASITTLRVPCPMSPAARKPHTFTAGSSSRATHNFQAPKNVCPMGQEAKGAVPISLHISLVRSKFTKKCLPGARRPNPRRLSPLPFRARPMSSDSACRKWLRVTYSSIYCSDRSLMVSECCTLPQLAPMPRWV